MTIPDCCTVSTLFNWNKICIFRYCQFLEYLFSILNSSFLYLTVIKVDFWNNPSYIVLVLITQPLAARREKLGASKLLLLK